MSSFAGIVGVVVGLLIGWRMGLQHARAELLKWVIENDEEEEEDPGCPACGWVGELHAYDCPLTVR